MSLQHFEHVFGPRVELSLPDGMRVMHIYDKLSMILRSACTAHVHISSTGDQALLLGVQDVRDGVAVTKQFHSIMQGLVDGMRNEQPAESSIAAHLLDIKDPETGQQPRPSCTP